MLALGASSGESHPEFVRVDLIRHGGRQSDPEEITEC
jgi:hypothetical protein